MLASYGTLHKLRVSSTSVQYGRPSSLPIKLNMTRRTWSQIAW